MADIILLQSAASYWILSLVLIRLHGGDSLLAKAPRADLKGWIALGICAVAVRLAFVNPAISGAMYVTVAILWLVPDRRIDRTLK